MQNCSRNKPLFISKWFFFLLDKHEMKLYTESVNGLYSVAQKERNTCDL